MRHERFPDIETAEAVDPHLGLLPGRASISPLAELVRLLALQAAHEAHADLQANSVRQPSSEEACQ